MRSRGGEARKQPVIRTVERSIKGSDAIAALGIPPPSALIVLNGGTAPLDFEVQRGLQILLGEGLASFVVDHSVTVITGGTDAGIFALFGRSLSQRASAPCIGVAPSELVSPPGATDMKERATLEPHHSHFLLVRSGKWGGETNVMMRLASALGMECPSLAVIASGGKITAREIQAHFGTRHIVTITGSGGSADRVRDIVGSAEASRAVVTGDLVEFPIDGAPNEFLRVLARELLSSEAA